MRTWPLVAVSLLGGCAASPGPSSNELVTLAAPAAACILAVRDRLGLDAPLVGGRTVMEGRHTISTWRNVQTPTGRKNEIRCEADRETAGVISVKADGVELPERAQR